MFFEDLKRVNSPLLERSTDRLLINLLVVWKKDKDKDNLIKSFGDWYVSLKNTYKSKGISGLKEENAFDSKDAATKSSCKKGCCHCCYIKLDVYESEATELFKSYDRSCDERVIKQSSASHLHPDDYVIELSKDDRKCPFLKDNLCSVYEHRPLSCSTYYVVSDPKECDTDYNNNNNNMVHAIVDNYSELAVSVISEESKPLSVWFAEQIGLKA